MGYFQAMEPTDLWTSLTTVAILSALAGDGQGLQMLSRWRPVHRAARTVRGQPPSHGGVDHVALDYQLWSYHCFNTSAGTHEDARLCSLQLLFELGRVKWGRN